MIIMRISKTPAGEAPEEVRREWVGCVLPPVARINEGFEEDGLCPLSPVIVGDLKAPLETISVATGMLVDTDEAIRILGEKSPEAAGWFLRNRTNLGPFLLFQEGEYELVRPE